MPRILFIEDDDIIRSLVRDFVTMYGFDYVEAQAGSEALNTLEQNKIDLVLCDLNLPGTITGSDILVSVRNNPLLHNLPFLILSAYADHAEIDRCLKLGANEFITKPFAYLTLIEKINNNLNAG